MKAFPLFKDQIGKNFEKSSHVTLFKDDVLIREWCEGELFPKRETLELTYKLSGQWEAFLNHVLDYCAEVVAAAGNDERRQRLNFWGTLALLRCASSSPVAAIKTLMTRGLKCYSKDANSQQLEDHVFDGSFDY